MSKISVKSAMTLLLMGTFLMGATTAQAATCAQRIRKAERNLEKAIQRHGLHSNEAEYRRDQLERARARCR